MKATPAQLDGAPGVDASLSGNAAWMLLAQLAVLGSGMAIIVAVGRVLGPEELGRWRFAQAILAYLVVLADAGFSAFAIREIARGRLRLGRFGPSLLAIRVATAASGLVLVLAALVVLGRPVQELALVAILCSSSLAAALNMGYVLQGKERFRQLAMVRAGAQLAGLAVALLGVLYFRSVTIAAVGVWVAAALAAALVSRPSAAARALQGRFRARDASSFLLRSLPFLGAGLATQAIASADTFILLLLRGEHELGFYAAPYAIAACSLFIGGAVMTAAYPRIASAGATRASWVIIPDLCAVMGCVSVPLAVGGALLSKPLLSDVFGPQYVHAWPVLCLLMALPLAGFLNMTLGQSLAALGEQRAVFRVALLCAIVSIAANLAAVACYGATGAAVVAVLVEGVTFIAYRDALLRRGIAVPVSLYLSSWPAGCVMALGLTLASSFVESSVVLGLLGGFLYAGAQLLHPSRGFQLLRALF